VLLWEALTVPWRACLEEAWAAYRAGSLPIGAAIADPAGSVIARGRNRIHEHEADGGLRQEWDMGRAEGCYRRRKVYAVTVRQSPAP